MKSKRGLYVGLIIAFSVLVFTNVFLFVQNTSYKNENRQLILQNDSIMSVNIQLKDTLGKTTGVGFIMK